MDKLITSDKEWEEDELLGLLQDVCLTRCELMQANIKRGIDVLWHDETLLHEVSLTPAVYQAVGCLVDLYDTCNGLDGFETAINKAVDEIVNNNKIYPRAK